MEYAKIAEDCGAAAITIHPRSKTMAFSGHSYWERITKVKNTVSIPVIGNGDIVTPQDGCDMFTRTGCDSIMIGRGVYGNPWIFGQIKQLLAGGKTTPPSQKDKLMTALDHLDAYIRLYGDLRAAKEMKKHIAWYIRGILGASTIRNNIFRATSTAELKNVLQQILSSITN